MGFDRSTVNKQHTNKSQDNSATLAGVIEKYNNFLQFGSILSTMLNECRYIARSDYQNMMGEYAPSFDFFSVLKNSGMLNEFCHKYQFSEQTIAHILDSYTHIETLVEHHNEKYVKTALIQERNYLDSILQAVDPGIVLDEDQRRVILTDEDYCLVVAGAGAGKTTTVAAKVKYLVDKKGIDPSQIVAQILNNIFSGILCNSSNQFDQAACIKQVVVILHTLSPLLQIELFAVPSPY